MRSRAEVVEEYLLLVRRDPAMPNAEVARRMGMTHKALARAIARARAAGELTVYRMNAGHGRIEIAPPGVTQGAPLAPDPAVARVRAAAARARRRRKKDLDRAA